MTSGQGKIIGLVLAGGQGTRMGGQDKGLVIWKDKPLIEHTAARLLPQVSSLVISANRNVHEYRQYAAHVVSDYIGLEKAPASSKNAAQYRGPLAGICAGIAYIQANPLQFADVEALLISPCDTPDLPNDLAWRLQAAQEQNGSDVCVAFDGVQIQPLHCLVGASQWEILLAFYRQGNQALRDWFSQVTTTQVDFSDCASAFRNINYQADLKEQ